ncbi:MAG: FxLYD domain-containing protein [Nitrososphaerales archaeon]
MRVKQIPLLFTLVLIGSVFSTYQVSAKASMDIVNKNFYLDERGFLHIVGEVENRDTSAFEFVQVTVTLYDSNGSAIGTKSGFPLVDVITPGNKSPFHIVYTDTEKAKEVARIEGFVSNTFATTPKEKGLQILSHDLFIDNQGYTHVAGEIRNNGMTNSTFTQVVATFYDHEGKVLAETFTITDPDNIQAGEKATFEAMLLQRELTRLISKYSLVAHSDEYEHVKVEEGENVIQIPPDHGSISVMTKIKKKAILLAVKNEGIRPVYGLELNFVDGDFTYVKARGWQTLVNSGNIILKTDDRPLINGRNIVALLAFDEAPRGELEWQAFDFSQRVLSSGTLISES